ncbi:MAG: NAD(P)/FAD-dependent oxidoreductase, partial [Chloroflexi bacterium]|nr:NAD(P)/FAD-dependent oxidoreductase [Chloroflexota bacterium]
MNEYDILIAGAGPAGLYLAKELSRNFRVLVIEKEEIGACHKVWLAWKENVLRHNLQDCVLCRPTRLVVGSRTNGLSVLPVDDDDYVAILDERRVLTKWAGEARARGAHLLDRCEITGARQNGRYILAETSQRNFAGRLLIDATGCFSAIVSRAQIAQEKYYYSFYGWIAQLDHVDLDELILVQSFLSKTPRPYVFFYPIDEKTGAPIIFFITERPVPLEEMRNEFQFHLEKVPEVAKNLAGFTPIEEKYGYVPLGRLKKSALDRILIVGDAGRLAPATIGSGFNFVLSAYHYFVPRIEQSLRQNTLSGRHLRGLTRVPRRMEDNL